jgi:hypothetical protein
VGTLASSTTNTGHHDIAEMALNTKNQTKKKQIVPICL